MSAPNRVSLKTTYEEFKALENNVNSRVNDISFTVIGINTTVNNVVSVGLDDISSNLTSKFNQLDTNVSNTLSTIVGLTETNENVATTLLEISNKLDKVSTSTEQTIASNIYMHTSPDNTDSGLYFSKHTSGTGLDETSEYYIQAANNISDAKIHIGKWKEYTAHSDTTGDGSKVITFDISNARVGVLNSHPTVELDISGSLSASSIYEGAQLLSQKYADINHVHNYEISDISGLQTALDGKTDNGHGHVISDVTGLQTALDGKTDNGHGHVISDVTGLQTALDGKTDNGHGHVISDVSGLQTDLDGRPTLSGTNTFSQSQTIQGDLSVSGSLYLDTNLDMSGSLLVRGPIYNDDTLLRSYDDEIAVYKQLFEKIFDRLILLEAQNEDLERRIAALEAPQ
jgi:hypothetical protein